MSRDGTFGSHQAILEAEFQKRTGKKLVVLDTLASALKFAGTASPLIEKEEHKFVDYDDLDGETSWDAGSARALEGAYGAVEVDYQAGLLRVPSDGDHHHGPREIASLEEFDEWITEVAFAGYEASAPRDSGEWVFEFDESRWIDEAQLHFEDELTKLGWLGT